MSLVKIGELNHCPSLETFQEFTQRYTETKGGEKPHTCSPLRSKKIFCVRMVQGYGPLVQQGDMHEFCWSAAENHVFQRYQAFSNVCDVKQSRAVILVRKEIPEDLFVQGHSSTTLPSVDWLPTGTPGVNVETHESTHACGQVVSKVYNKRDIVERIEGRQTGLYDGAL